MAKWLVVAGLLGVLAAFLIYTSAIVGSGPPPELKAPGPPAPAPETSDGSTPVPKLVLTSSQQCTQCHADIFNEWKKDQHATAWTEDNFRSFTLNYTQLECLSCHAPKPMLEVGIDKEPQLRDANRADGVDCFTCHMAGGKSHGTLGSNAPCGGVFKAELKMSQACYHCHSTHNLFKEFLASPQYKQGQTCQDCHMEKIERAVASGGPLRTTRRHFIHGGGHDTAALKKALKIDLAVEHGELIVTVTNSRAAHGVPGEINNRIVRLEVSVQQLNGKRIEEGKEVEAWQEMQAHEAIFQAPPRLSRDKIPSTQIMPGQPRVLKYNLSIPRGRAIATLSYMLEKSMLKSEATPMGEQTLDF